MLCNYRYCRDELPEEENGNRRYCDNNCYMVEKLERSKDIHANKKKVLLEIERNETLLRVFHNKYRDAHFDINLLRDKKIDWSISTGSISIDGVEYRLVSSFAYAAFTEGTAQILKL